ncbi:transcriptional regulator family: Fungal Specific TF [Penicillium macrosclerotiorum]|uniref:transcriptional regulator family: Fungal Specific TF n=1 Tax=Penicillium macrosclerotiorum TaxID=303699 RepID=UPI002547C081|nr:transcriptional regulator family: Fungal Specific TF [Penicillium macrosclerotiorum]KAJ5690255.1 transcriptional regulator family: Fungal Specific TF [Penicillium macrosclerotiorum]
MAAERGPPKRRCVSTACIACRRRKSKCDGNLPSCAACSSVYHTPCVYDPNSDNRRKGVYKKDADTLRTKHTTLQTLIQALLNYEEEDAFDLVRQLRSCDDLEEVAQSVIAREKGLLSVVETPDNPERDDRLVEVDQFEAELAGKMSELMLDGSRKFIGGTSNLIFLPPGSELHESTSMPEDSSVLGSARGTRPVRRWTEVTDDNVLISHLLTMYFTWHYPFFTILAKDLFYRDYIQGISSPYCSALLVNAMLALGCHFSSWSGAFDDPQNLSTAGNHFFKEAKRLVLENDEHETAKLCTVQAFALMSVREAGCGREGKGWVYSGLSFRMAFDLGLNVDASHMGSHSLTDEEIDARRITFWGCYLIDKAWSNYLGRQPQLSSSNSNVPKFDVLPREEQGLWSPYTDSGVSHENSQPSRTRAVALQISKLCEITSDILVFFYHPAELEKTRQKQSELKRLSGVHTRIEAWRKELPRELEPKEGQLPQVLVMHMLHQLLLIHLYRPFLKYTKSNTPLPAHVSPRKICTQAASTISKLMRMYKRTYGLKQIVNIVVYIAHTACTIHLLNLPEKNAQRDVVHGLRNLEEMAEGWLCARRTLRILDISASKWQVELPSEASTIFERTHAKWGSWGSWDQATSPSISEGSPAAHNNMPSSVASPHRFSPATNQAPLVASSTEPVAANAPVSTMGTSMGPQYPSAPGSMPTAMPALHAARGMSGLQPQRVDLVTPEPTYLRPMSHVGYPVPNLASPSSSAASPNPSSWYDAPGAQIGPQNTTPGSNASTMSGFEGPENLVEESQDWWSRNSASLGLGMESWAGPWGPGMQNSPTHLQYDGSHGHMMPMAPNTSPASGAEHQSQVTARMSDLGPVAYNDMSGYDDRWK